MRQAVIETIAVVYQLTKRTLWRRNCSPIGHNNKKHFLRPIRSRHLLEFLETVRWESVPRGSFVRTWKLSSCLFSRPDWLPLGLRGWCTVNQNILKRGPNKVRWSCKNNASQQKYFEKKIPPYYCNGCLHVMYGSSWINQLFFSFITLKYYLALWKALSWLSRKVNNTQLCLPHNNVSSKFKALPYSPQWYFHDRTPKSTAKISSSSKFIFAQFAIPSF